MGAYACDWPLDLQEAFKEATIKRYKEAKHFMWMDPQWATNILEIKKARCENFRRRDESGTSKHILRIDKARELLDAHEVAKANAAEELPNIKPETKYSLPAPLLEMKVARLEHQIADVRAMAIQDKVCLQAVIDTLKGQTGQAVKQTDKGEVEKLKARIQTLLNSTSVDWRPRAKCPLPPGCFAPSTYG